MTQRSTESEALAERVFASTIALFDLATIHIGDRLGLYRALHAGGPATSGELAERTGTDERYVRVAIGLDSLGARAVRSAHAGGGEPVVKVKLAVTECRARF